MFSTGVNIPSPPSVVSDYAKYLQSIYANAPLTYPDKLTPDITTNYIKLALVIKKRRIREAYEMKKEIKIDDLFTADKSERVRLVVVEGAPGIGKSTFALELCRQWPLRKSLQCFYLVVLLRLREKNVRSAKYIRDLFWGGESHDSNIIYEEVSKENGKGVLFVFDGFDEYPPELRESSDSDSPVMNLLRGTRELPEATILVTSRPSVKTALQPLMRNKNTKNIEIVGFGEEEIQKYSSCAFESNPEMLKSFNEYLSVNPVVKSMMYNPLNCSIITEVYQATSEAGRTIPDTQTQLYTEMTLWRLSRYLRTNDPNAKIPPSVAKVPPDSTLYQQVVKMICKLPDGKDLYQRLVKLGELALEGKRKETVIYDDVNLPSDCLDLGLLVEHRALYGRSESATYNFFHLTMQEYMSAFYIAQLPADEQKSLFLNKQKSVFWNRDKSMDVVWRFVAGLTKMKEIGWDTVYGGRMHALFVECVFEAQDIQSVCNHCVFDPQEYYKSSELSSYGGIALGYCISGLNISWNLLLLNLSDTSVKMLEKGMHNMNDGSGSIMTLTILYSPGIMGHLLHMSPRNIKTLGITGCEVGSVTLLDAFPTSIV